MRPETVNELGQQRCYNYTPSQLTYATESGSFSKDDKVVAARPHNGIPRGARGVVIGHTDQVLRVDFGGRCVLSRIGDLAHAPLVAGSHVRKGDRVAARVAYGSVQVNDLGTVVGSGDQKSQRVCVVWDRDGAKNNWLPGAQLAVVDARRSVRPSPAPVRRVCFSFCLVPGSFAWLAALTHALARLAHLVRFGGENSPRGQAVEAAGVVDRPQCLLGHTLAQRNLKPRLRVLLIALLQLLVGVLAIAAALRASG